MRFTGLIAVAVLVTAVAPLHSQQQSPQPEGRWFRLTDGIPIADTSGRQIAEPFLGGMNLPRPQLVDIDGDGDLDLFVQERRDDLKFFERDGGAWHWRTDRWQDVEIGEWFRFADLDGDGDLDLLAEQRVGYIKAFRNEGDRERALMVPVPDSLRDITGNPIFADPQNILNVVDIDCNNRQDLFLGRVAGHVDRYEQETTDANGLPVFRLMATRWQGIEVLGPIPGDTAAFDGRPTMHGANTMAFGDVDSDGDLDLFWGDFFEAGVLLIRNEGSCSAPWLQGEHEQFPRAERIITTGYNAPATGDVNQDGTLDLVIGVIGGAYQPNYSATDNLYEVLQGPAGEWTVTTRRLIGMVDVGAESAPALADVDGDGDLDLLIGNKIEPTTGTDGTLTYFENVGSVSEPSFRDRGLLDVTGSYHLSPAMADLDGDGRLDLVLGTWRDQVEWWRNVGGEGVPRFERMDTAVVTLTRGSNTTPTLADLDSDGDLDMIVGEASGQLNLFRNDGSAVSPRFELVSDELSWIDVGRRAAPLLVDIDGDGVLELVVGNEDGEVKVFRRNSGEEIGFTEDVDLRFEIRDGNATPAAGDLFDRGAVNFLFGSAGGGLRRFELAPK